MFKGCRSEILYRSVVHLIAYKLVLTFMFSLRYGGQQERTVMAAERLRRGIVQQQLSTVLQRQKCIYVCTYKRI